MMSSWTCELAYRSSPPMGAKMTPTAKKSGRTVFGVRMGCQAFSRCCRKAVSSPHDQSIVIRRASECRICVLGGLRLFCFFSGSSCSRTLLVSSIVVDMLATVMLQITETDDQL